MSRQHTDILIIGHGLAGALLAWALEQRGLKAVVVDEDLPVSTSRTAAGLINPITGQRLVLTPRIEQLLPKAVATYEDLERRLGQQLFFPLPMWRLFRSEKEQEKLALRRQEPEYDPYLGSDLGNPCCAPFDASMGGVEQHHSGYLDTVALLDGLRDHFRLHGRFITTPFAHSQLQIDEHGVNWGDWRAGKVIFCEGYRVSRNPWFDWLPMTPAKGEILTVRAELPRSHILNAGTWLVPRNNGLFKLGSNYEWEQLDEVVTEAAREHLLQRLRLLAGGHLDVEVVEQAAGVRPATQDRQPIVGLHPEQPKLGVFNGFGSRGSLSVPWCAERFVEHLLDDRPLPLDIDIARLQQ